MNNDVLREARRLHALGFAILWLHPKSKRPIEMGWTKGERHDWKTLEKTYTSGFNVGVRLGRSSKMGSGYLTAIDCDIRKDEFKAEAYAEVDKLIRRYPCPIVVSGRGNGSRHYYCLTSAPFKTWNPVSNENYEISLYSDGRQVVLPPSVHPDSGKTYQWAADGIRSIQDLPLIELPAEPTKKGVGNTVKGGDAVLQDYKYSPVELAWLEVSDAVKAGIMTGEGVVDRSGFLLRASAALLSAGLSRDEVLTVLTDPGTYLGKCAYEHVQSNSRAKAAAWVWRYTLKRTLTERAPELVFDPIEEKPSDSDKLLTPEEQAAQSEEFEAEAGFYTRGKNGALKPEYDLLLREFQEEHPFKTIADMKAVFSFNGTHYVDISPFEIKAFVEDKLNPKPSEKIRAEFHHKVLANQVARRSFFTDSTEGKVNFKNGVLDLESEELLDHSEDYGFRGVLPFDYSPDAECPVFRKWLRGVMVDDEELEFVLQEFMGYVVRGGEYKYHKALWLGGVGRNGKSTFIDLLKALIGNGNFSVMSIKTLMTDRFAGSDLDGKIANFSEETSPQELADSGPFKNLTGDGDLFTQKKFGDPYSFRNRAKLIMTYNQIPDLKDLSAGMLSRPLIIPFRKIIKEEDQDRGIKKKLFKELPGIFNFALEGWRRLEDRGGFTPSAQSALALNLIKQESCNVYQWVENHVKASFDEQRYRPHELYAIYSKQERFAYREIEFYRRLTAHPLMRKRKRRGKDGFFYEHLSVR